MSQRIPDYDAYRANQARAEQGRDNNDEAARRTVVVTSLSQLDWLVEVIAETTKRRGTP